jgi:sialate O-acetylesterase
MEAKTTPQESSWASLRQQQLNTLTVPNTAMAVMIDAGDWNDVHHENKEIVGHRLALLARKNLYGEKSLIASGPLYQSMKTDGNKITLSFTNTGTGLAAKGNSELKQFSIAGADGKFVWARAIIKGNTVVVWSDEITNPVTVRYAWADNPEGANLYNKEGLPASPFTTENK